MPTLDPFTSALLQTGPPAFCDVPPHCERTSKKTGSGESIRKNTWGQGGLPFSGSESNFLSGSYMWAVFHPPWAQEAEAAA